MQIRINQATLQKRMYLAIELITATVLLLLARQIYMHHPFYVGFLTEQAKQILVAILYLLLILSWSSAIYRFLFAPIEEQKTKYVLVAVLLMKILYRVGLWLKGDPEYKKIKLEIDFKTKVALLSFLVKFYYLPLMVSFTLGSWAGVTGGYNTLKNGIGVNFDTYYHFIVNCLFLLDTTIFAFGYAIESKFLKNQIKSVEPTMLGWVVTLSVYPPFNGLTGQFIIMAGGGMTFLGANEITYKAIRILILICYIIFVGASVALGPKGSNLTNRGIVSWGPYAVVRHPAYASKLIAWGLEGFLFASNFYYFLGWLGFAFIYYMRAITEERHLSMDPDYIAYKEKVKYKFIPKVW